MASSYLGKWLLLDGTSRQGIGSTWPRETLKRHVMTFHLSEVLLVLSLLGLYAPPIHQLSYRTALQRSVLVGQAAFIHQSSRYRRSPRRKELLKLHLLIQGGTSIFFFLPKLTSRASA